MKRRQWKIGIECAIERNEYLNYDKDMKAELPYQLTIEHLHKWKESLEAMREDYVKKEEYEEAAAIQKQIDILDHYISDEKE